MTQFNAVSGRGSPRKRYVSGAVVDLLASMSSAARWPTVPGKTMTIECILGLRLRAGAFSVRGYDPITGVAQLRSLVRGRLEGSVVPNRLRVAGALDLLASPRARDGTELLEQFGLGERGRWGFCPLSGPERQRLFLVLAQSCGPGRT
jgi:ABC-type multidrug transport system ATPase subunit